MKKLNMKKLMSLFLSLTLLFALSACNSKEDSDLSYVKSKGTLIIGYTNYAPMNYYDENGNFTGFDTDLAILVCEKLGVKPEFVEINGFKEVELNAKSIDCILNGLTINDERKATWKLQTLCKECPSSFDERRGRL